MAIVFMTDPVTGRCALYDEPTTSGDPEDPNSARNAPLNNSAAYFAYIYFHTDFDDFEVVDSGSKSINHSSVSAPSTPTGFNTAFDWNLATDDHNLLTHDLGSVPWAMVVRGNNVLWPGMPIQTNGTDGMRFCSAYVTSTQVRLQEWACGGTDGLPAASRNYSILVFKDPPAASGTKLLDVDPGTGIVTMGLEKFKSSRNYLQVVPGGSPFAFSLGRTIDLDNGAMRAWNPDGTSYEPVPASMRSTIIPGTGSYGDKMGYEGSYADPGAVLVQAP